MAYFEKLNYSLSNEDTRVEYELLPKQVERVFSVAGSGARVLPLLARHPRSLEISDLSDAQLFLCELRISAAKKLTYPEFLFLLGYRSALPGKGGREKLFRRLDLSRPCADFWGNHQQWLQNGFIFLGKWESHFRKLRAAFRKLVPINVQPIFEARSLTEQVELYHRYWRPIWFRGFLRLFANEYVFNKFLYKGHFSGSKDRSTETRPPWLFIDDQFRRLFTTTLVRENYFLQILFLGSIPFEEGLPLEARPEIIESIRSAEDTKIVYRLGDLTEQIGENRHHFISLSDTISYLPPGKAGRILELLHPQTPAGAKVVIRSFLRMPRKIHSAGWQFEERESRWATEFDGTGVYRFHVFRKL